MSVDTSHTTARFSALVIDRQRCYSAQYVPSMVFPVVCSAKTLPQHRSFKPSHPIQYRQSQDPGALTASATYTAIKSP